MTPSASPTPRRGWRVLVIVSCALVLLAVGAIVGLRKAFPPQRLAALLADEVRAATGRELRIGGDLSFRWLPTIAVVAEEVSLGNAPWGTRREMATVRRAAFDVAVSPLLRGQVHVLSIAVEGADVLLETDARGRPNWIFDDRGKPAASSPTADTAPGAAIALDKLTIADSLVAYRSGLTRQTRTVAIESLTLLNEGAQTVLSARFAGEHQAWRLEGKTGHYAALLEHRADWPFDVQVVASGARLTARGALLPDGEVQAAVSARIDKAAPLTPLFADAAALPLPIEGSANVRRSATALSADALALSLAGQSLAGKLALRTERGSPRLDVELSATSIDLARWGMQPPARTAAKPPPGPKQPLFGDAPLPALTLPAIPLHANLRIERLVVPGLPPVSALKAQLKVEPGRLSVEPLSLALGGGQASARLDLVARSGEPLRATLRAEASGLPLQALDALISGDTERVRSGRTDLRLNLQATGRTPRELAASASGQALLSVTDATLAGGAAVMERNLLVALLQALLPKQEADRALQIQCAVVSVPLKDGVAAIDRSIALETDKVAVSASGELNLARQSVTLGFHPVVKKGIGIDSSANLAKLVRLEGPLQDPNVAIDMMGTAREAANIGAAVATAGLTLVGKRLLSGPEETQVCKRALGEAKP